MLGEGQNTQGFLYTASTCQDAELGRQQADYAKVQEKQEKAPTGGMLF
jgi:hypothetical protein